MGEDQLAACHGKEAFLDRHHARKAAARRLGRVAYKCKVCGLWHVGSKDRRGRYRRVRNRNGHLCMQW
jgi:hypothetical protein